ncbi:hypothetical protein B0H13DRAFT_1850520 [Mycena leptocephala]|nr:hypothetical protein B0H13DRAFT_1850520 [Mycena leptocephala]
MPFNLKLYLAALAVISTNLRAAPTKCLPQSSSIQENTHHSILFACAGNNWSLGCKHFYFQVEECQNLEDSSYGPNTGFNCTLYACSAPDNNCTGTAKTGVVCPGISAELDETLNDQFSSS